MEKTLYIDNTKFSVEVSKFDWHQSQSEIQCILVFLSADDKRRFLKAIEEFFTMQLDDMMITKHWYNDIAGTQAIVFNAYYSVSFADNHRETSWYEEFGCNPNEVNF